MRTRIFTERERVLIRSLLEGRITIKDRAIHVTVSRVRHFKELSGDVDLYLQLRVRTETKGTASA